MMAVRGALRLRTTPHRGTLCPLPLLTLLPLLPLHLLPCGSPAHPIRTHPNSPPSSGGRQPVRASTMPAARSPHPPSAQWPYSPWGQTSRGPLTGSWFGLQRLAMAGQTPPCCPSPRTPPAAGPLTMGLPSARPQPTIPAQLLRHSRTPWQGAWAGPGWRRVTVAVRPGHR